jgi:hypothetical protein
MVTAHALYVYLVENPASHARPPREAVHHVSPLVNVLDETDRRLRW